jgi:hypothetical protein
MSPIRMDQRHHALHEHMGTRAAAYSPRNRPGKRKLTQTRIKDLRIEMFCEIMPNVSEPTSGRVRLKSTRAKQTTPTQANVD